MRTLALFLILATSLSADTKRLVLPKETVKRPVIDKKFLTTMAILGASKAFDMTSTARGVCQENNRLLGPHPSNRRIAIVASTDYAEEVVGAFLLKKVFRHHKWLGKVWLIEPAIQSEEHIRWGAKNIASGCTQ